MKKVIKLITISILFIFSNPVQAYAIWLEKWDDESKYLFTALISAQMSDFSQSIKINNPVNDCRLIYLETMDGRIIKEDYTCKERYIYKESNPMAADGNRFSPTKLVLTDAITDVGVLYLGTKYPKLQKPILYGLYLLRFSVIINNNNIGLKTDFPVLPIIFTYNF